MLALAPDLAASPSLRRIEGEVALGERFAAQLSVAYKGVWVRTTKSFARRGGAPAGWADAELRFTDFAACLDPTLSGGLPAGSDWRAEACIGAMPLSPVATAGRPAARRLPSGSLAVVSARIATESGPWHGGCPVILGGDGKPGRFIGGNGT
jgi:hypothetical protein